MFAQRLIIVLLLYTEINLIISSSSPHTPKKRNNNQLFANGYCFRTTTESDSRLGIISNLTFLLLSSLYLAHLN